MDRDQFRHPLDADGLRAAIRGTWREVAIVAETGSTNADLLGRAASGADIDGVVLIAEHQRAGRGRHGRGWSASPRAQLTMSVGVRVADVPAGAWGWLPLATGVAILDAVAPLLAGTGAEAGLKWPNDVLAGVPGGHGKLAGILTEVARPYAVVGLGLNVTQDPVQVEGARATSLLDLGVTAPDRDRLAAVLLTGLGARIAAWRAAGGSDAGLVADYRARSLTIGSRVRAELPGGREVVGTAGDVDDQGRLRIVADGETVIVSAGDVVHLRV